MISELIIPGLLFLLWAGKGSPFTSTTKPAAKPSKAPWPQEGKPKPSTGPAPPKPVVTTPLPEKTVVAPASELEKVKEPLPAQRGPIPSELKPKSEVPIMQKGASAPAEQARRIVEQMKKEQAAKGEQGTGKRQFKPKRKGLTKQDIARAKELLPLWQKGKTWRANDNPTQMFKAAMHGKKRAIEVWTSDTRYW
jgi:hypothetical protein